MNAVEDMIEMTAVGRFASKDLCPLRHLRARNAQGMIKLAEADTPYAERPGRPGVYVFGHQRVPVHPAPA